MASTFDGLYSFNNRFNFLGNLRACQKIFPRKHNSDGWTYIGKRSFRFVILIVVTATFNLTLLIDTHSFKLDDIGFFNTEKRASTFHSENHLHTVFHCNKLFFGLNLFITSSFLGVLYHYYCLVYLYYITCLLFSCTIAIGSRVARNQWSNTIFALNYLFS